MSKKLKKKKDAAVKVKYEDIRPGNPSPMMDTLDYDKRFAFSQVEQTRIEQICKWKAHDSKGNNKNVYIK